MIFIQSKLTEMKQKEDIVYGKLKQLQITDPHFIGTPEKMNPFMFWKVSFHSLMAARKQGLERDNSSMYREANSTLTRILKAHLVSYWYITPPQFEKFFEEIGIPVEEGDKSSFQPPTITPAVIENVVKTAAKYGVEIKL